VTMGAERFWEWQMMAVVLGDRLEAVAAVLWAQADVEVAGWTSAVAEGWAR
jgi:hypothetical protein